jgi:DNA-binding NarL/FixJ family response regulator
MSKISVLICEDLQLIRDVWGQLLNADPRFEVVAICESGEKALSMVDLLKPDVLVTDITMKGIDGFELTQLVRASSPATRILAVSMHIQVSYAKKIMSLGAGGYVTKNSPVEELCTAIVDIYHGKKYICEEIKQSLASRLTDDDTPSSNSLSVREMEIVNFVKSGLSSVQIGERLQLSKKTVEAHRYNIMKKLSVKNTASLVNFMNTAD